MNGDVVYIQGVFPAEEPRPEDIYEQIEDQERAATFCLGEWRTVEIYSDAGRGQDPIDGS